MRNREILSGLLDRMKEEDFSGWDPYDGLESRVFRFSQMNRFRTCRLAWEQAFKMSPVNFRKIFLVPKKRNPKGIALIVLGLINLYKKTRKKEHKKQALRLLDWLEENMNKKYGAWGYPFDWQSRLFFAPKNTPNMVCTYFVGLAFLKAYRTFGNRKHLSMAESAGKFMHENLYRSGTYFSYIPLDRGKVHNVNMFGAEFLLRLWKENKNREYRKTAEKALEFTLGRQNSDGSWYYGEEPQRKWIDNFHTGYVLCSLKYVSDVLMAGKKALKKGYEFYTENLFTQEGVPKYYHDSLYPIDIHCCSQAILTFLELQDLDKTARKRAQKILDFTLENMYSENNHFYFQKHSNYTIRIPYMRWSQCWMFYALSELV